MSRLSVNINKIATLRNARGGNIPNVIEVAKNAETYGAQGITVHPRPDERHIRYSDVRQLSKVVTTEFNVEGYPSEKFMALVLEVVPEQVTLVPDPPDVLTSNEGWDTRKNKEFLRDITGKLKEKGIRTSIFIDTNLENIENAPATGTDRVELYTGPYAENFPEDPGKAIQPYQKAAKLAYEMGLGINAGHDLDLNNLRYFNENLVPGTTNALLEVSIGHALISDAIYYGLENTIQLYLQKLESGLDK